MGESPGQWTQGTAPRASPRGSDPPSHTAARGHSPWALSIDAVFRWTRTAKAPLPCGLHTLSLTCTLAPAAGVTQLRGMTLAVPAPWSAHPASGVGGSLPWPQPARTVVRPGRELHPGRMEAIRGGCAELVLSRGPQPPKVRTCFLSTASEHSLSPRHCVALDVAAPCLKPVSPLAKYV